MGRDGRPRAGRLGAPTGLPINGPGSYEQFDNGLMVWNKALKRIYVLYNYYRPVAGQLPVHVQWWAGFDDTFGS